MSALIHWRERATTVAETDKLLMNFAELLENLGMVGAVGDLGGVRADRFLVNRIYSQRQDVHLASEIK